MNIITPMAFHLLSLSLIKEKKAYIQNDAKRTNIAREDRE